MRIVHIEDFFHPDAGYQINILPKYMVKQGHEVIIVTSEIDKVPSHLTNFFGKEGLEKSDKDYEKETGVKIVRLPVKRFISSRAVFKSTIFKEVDNLKPDILYVHGNDTLIGIQYTLRCESLAYPIVLDSHMLEMASKNRLSKLFKLFYKTVITPLIIKNKIKVIRTQDDKYVSESLGIPLELSPWISVGSDTLLFHPDREARENFRQEFNISKDDFVVVYAGKLNESKGAKLLLEAFENKIVPNNEKKIVAVIVGNTEGEYGKELEILAKKSENKLLRFPTQKYTDLPKFYQIADLSVFPKQCSLSFFDVQACGLPVIAENNNINIDRLKNRNGEVFLKDNKEDLIKKIVTMAEMSSEDFIRLSQNAVNYVKSNFDYEDIAKQYTSLLINEYKRFRSGV